MIRRDWILLTLCVSLTLLLTSPLVAAKPKCPDGTCNGNETAESCPADCDSGSGGGGDSFFSTCDTFSDAVGYRVRSDGQGLDTTGNAHRYCDSERQVEAFIGATNGGHKLDTEKSARWLDLSFTTENCAGEPCVGTAEGFDGPTEVEAVLSIESGSAYGAVDLLAMPQGVPTPVGLIIGFKNGRKNHVRLSFGRDSTIVNCPDGLGNHVTVTRGSSPNEFEWTFESDPLEKACLSEVVNNDWNSPRFRGYYHMPFLLTVKIQP